MQKLELTLKLVATAVAVAVFLGLGAGTLVFIPPPENEGDGEYSAGSGSYARSQAGLKDLPVPPYTAEMYAEETERADIYIYESRLGGEDILRFYSDELPRRGWERAGRPPGDVIPAEEAGREAMYFTDGRRVCIINLEEKDAYSRHITVIKTTTN